MISAVLFDLDGTLLDTAPDMVASLHDVLAEESAPLLPYAHARAYVSHGVNGLLRAGFGEIPETTHARLHRRFLEIYARRLAAESALFNGMDSVLHHIETARIPWGVVTNKPALLTEPLLEQLGLRRRCACVVSGDTTAHRKPHPHPLLHALQKISAPAAQAIYVGDAQRDIQAGRAAGMRTVAALYGYIPQDENPADWGADHQIDDPLGLVNLLQQLYPKEAVT